MSFVLAKVMGSTFWKSSKGIVRSTTTTSLQHMLFRAKSSASYGQQRSVECNVYLLQQTFCAPKWSAFFLTRAKRTQFLGKRTILPQRDQSAAPAECIMWVTHEGDLTDRHWVLGRFVPLLPLHSSSDVPLVVVEMEDISDNTFNTGFLSERWAAKCYSIYINPFTAPACKISGQKTCMDVPANSIFSGPITSTLILYLLIKVRSCASAKKNTERLKGFRFCTLIGHFQVTLWQWRG